VIDMSELLSVEGDAPQELATSSAFRDLNLSEPLVRALESSGYVTPTPIQAQTIPLLLQGRDVLGQAQTGTGKTAAFALPMLQRIDLAERHPQVLVLAPTRELAIQVAESFERYAAHMPGLRVASIYGGQDYMLQFRALDRGVHVVVGTPGRVMDHMRRGSLKLERLRGLVLDEADEMLRMGFAEDVEWVLTQSPAQRQIALFSATMPDPIRRIAQQHLREPAEITIEQKTAAADTIRQRYVVSQPHQKDEVLHRILESETIDGVIVFVKMKSTTEPLAEFLTARGHRSAALNGDIPQAQRERIVDALKAGKLDVLVATDVAARGLDVQRISHVVNFDLPYDSEAYVHRIGRTGRAGREGQAILLVTPREQSKLRRLEYATRHKIEPMEVPSNRAINKRRVAKFHDRITAALARPDITTFTSIVDQYRRDKEVSVEQIAAALAILAAGDSPLLLTGELEQARFDDRRGRMGERERGHGPRDRHGDRGHRDRGFGERGGERGGSERGEAAVASEVLAGIRGLKVASGARREPIVDASSCSPSASKWAMLIR
jgi:ATP-dependent RNA helicase DeaD